MVGLAVLPFSATWEIFKVWIFGELWCSMWLAVDVWMCTGKQRKIFHFKKVEYPTNGFVTPSIASILNLCAISMDRYLAVTRPVTYPSIMSSRKAKLLIAAVWILSFVICFPPLVGWNDRKRTFFRRLITNATHGGVTERGMGDFGIPMEDNDLLGQRYHVEECFFTCELTSDKVISHYEFY